MKKILFIVVSGALLFTSCKKDYTCTCNYTINGSALGDPEVIIYTNTTKSAARANCQDLSSNDEFLGQPITIEAACELK